ncbi:response regulator [Roseivirga misakiensis]|uniref:Response regulatory domain-containing protein n=1 Tax=Roseivirga misakiensis TaxID=1563681 RepID=A0A1E5SLG8_9BACT|nr:response regulator [Roseivirga misakiensis]OEJ99967.1 hypothetical protein BFP71_10515 [Roseivirga misakiensis]
MRKKTQYILVVDDNEINRRYVKTALKELNTEVIIAKTGFEALDIAEKAPPHLILVDIQMPLMDGYECFTLLREKLGNEVPILAITAFSDLDDRDDFIAYGFSDCILKPVRPEVLRNTVSHWFNYRMPHQQNQSNSEQSDFDFGIINELKRYASNEELTELYNEFIKETNLFGEKLVFLQTTQNYPEILSILHVIKGNAGSLGFAKLSELTSVLETDIKSGDHDSLSIRIQELVDYSSKIFSVFKAQQTLINA